MGQLEKYGLYVLCLVIFLILGVTIWGNPDVPGPRQKNEPVPMRVAAAGNELGNEIGNGNRTNGNLGSGDVTPVSNRSGNGGSNMLQSLLRPVDQPKTNRRPSNDKPINNTNRKPDPKPEVPPVGDIVKTPPAPVAKTRKYTVKKGDILGRIAQKQLGSVRYVGAIRDANPGLSDNLKIGQVIVLPANVGTKPAKTTAASGTWRTYTISKGDTFERIARVELKSRSRVREIQDLNPNVNPTRLIPGKKIKLPLE